MARAYLSFDLDDPEDLHQFRLADAAARMAGVLWELDQHFRGELKYGDLTEGGHQALERAREELHEQLSLVGLDLDHLAR
jgi:hypothetical protein